MKLTDERAQAVDDILDLVSHRGYVAFDRLRAVAFLGDEGLYALRRWMESRDYVYWRGHWMPAEVLRTERQVSR